MELAANRIRKCKLPEEYHPEPLNAPVEWECPRWVQRSEGRSLTRLEPAMTPARHNNCILCGRREVAVASPGALVSRMVNRTFPQERNKRRQPAP